jgi:hypothetical protein
VLGRKLAALRSASGARNQWAGCAGRLAARRAATLRSRLRAVPHVALGIAAVGMVLERCRRTTVSR